MPNNVKYILRFKIDQSYTFEVGGRNKTDVWAAIHCSLIDSKQTICVTCRSASYAQKNKKDDRVS